MIQLPMCPKCNEPRPGLQGSFCHLCGTAVGLETLYTATEVEEQISDALEQADLELKDTIQTLTTELDDRLRAAARSAAERVSLLPGNASTGFPGSAHTPERFRDDPDRVELMHDAYELRPTHDEL